VSLGPSLPEEFKVQPKVPRRLGNDTKSRMFLAFQ
jgi:hypothetical protein